MQFYKLIVRKLMLYIFLLQDVNFFLVKPNFSFLDRFGWTANMQRIITSQTHAKTQDMQRDYYLNQKKALEINPRHPLIKELLRRVEDNPEDVVAKDMALMMYNTATLRSGYMLKDTVAFAQHVGKFCYIDSQTKI